MRKFAVLAAVSVAAFAASAAAAQEASPFAGPYVGVQVSYGQLSTKHSDLDWWYTGVIENEHKGDGGLGGLKLGYNFVRGNILAGIELEGQMGKLDSRGVLNREYDLYSTGSKSKLLGSARAKLGLTTGNLAFAVNGGVAFNNATQSYIEQDGDAEENFSGKGDRVGYVLGLGASYAVSSKSFVGLDISRYQFGNKKHELEQYYDEYEGYYFNVRDRYETISISYNYKF